MGIFDRFRRKVPPSRPFCSAVVPAAGSATRMEGQDKMLALLGDWPVLVHTLKALEASSLIDEIVIVTRGDLIVTIGQLCKDYALSKVSKVVVGGSSRTRSVLSGMREVAEQAALVAVHDGARPLVSVQVIDETILRATACHAAAPAVPVKDTLKRAVDGWVEETVVRDTVFAIQTPQVFDADLLLGALQKAEEDGACLTDDCAAVERLGMRVALTQGSYENIKITTPVDLIMAEAILQGREMSCG